MSNTQSESQIVQGLLHIAAFARSRQWQSSEKLDVTPTQLAILRVLFDRGALRISAIGKQLGVTQATASDAVAALEAKDLIERKADPADARARLATLTEIGRRMAAQRHEAPTELIEAFQAMDNRERAGVLRGLTIAIRHLQEAGDIEPQRFCVSCRYFHPNTHDDAEKPHHCGFVNAAFGDSDLRLDCGDHELADGSAQQAAFRGFSEDNVPQKQCVPLAATSSTHTSSNPPNYKA